MRLGGARRRRPRGGGGAVGTGGKHPARVLLVGRAALGRLTALLVFCRWRSRGTEKSSDFAAGTSWGGPGLELGEHPDSGPGPACGVTPPPLLGAKTSCKVKRAARRGGSSPRGLACPLRDAGPAAPRAPTQATCPVRWADGPVLGSTGTEPLSPALLQLLPAPGLRAGLGSAAPRRGSLTAPAPPPGHRSKVPPCGREPQIQTVSAEGRRAHRPMGETCARGSQWTGSPAPAPPMGSDRIRCPPSEPWGRDVLLLPSPTALPELFPRRLPRRSLDGSLSVGGPSPAPPPEAPWSVSPGGVSPRDWGTWASRRAVASGSQVGAAQ